MNTLPATLSEIKEAMLRLTDVTPTEMATIIPNMNIKKCKTPRRRSLQDESLNAVKGSWFIGIVHVEL